MCSTTVYHTSIPEDGVTYGESSVFSTPKCSTTVYHKRLSGLWRRGGVYQFRVRVPADLVALFGRTHINRSLRTASYRDALATARTISMEISEGFEVCRATGQRAELGAVPLAKEAPMQSVRPASPERRSGLTLLEAWNSYLADPGSARTRKTAMAYETVRNLVVAILGPDRLVNEVTRQDCRLVLETLQHLPSNYEKRWPGTTPQAAAQMAQKQSISPMTAANCNGYMSRWSGMMNWLVKEELVARNPCVGLRVADPVAARDKRLPFTSGQLERIFSGRPYTDLLRIVDGSTRPTVPSHFYIPLIALFSGLRQNEICQQTVDDIVEVDGVFCFVVKADAALGKRVKTQSSERIVPLHPALIRANLLSHWRHCVRVRQVRLWPELNLDRFGYASPYFSKWFGRYLLKVEGNRDRTSFHSFRHCFRDALRAARIEREIAYALGGWTTGASGMAAVGDLYGSGFPVAALNEAISRVAYSIPTLSPLMIERGE
ncbi:MAG: site-specific integrase [Pseudomonadota bacterium]|nr:site-specific integrase [Pseudomonadota bacterium]